MRHTYFLDWIYLILLVLIVLMFALAFDGHCEERAARAIVTTYAKHYSDSARVHPNRRYHPDSLCVASGWRELYGEKIILCHGAKRLTVKVTDVMNARYNDCDTLHLDCSPRVMRELGLSSRAWIDSVGVFTWH